MTLRVSVYDKAFQWLGTVGAPLRVRAVPRHNAIGTVEMTLPSTHRLVPALVEPGARIVVEYNGGHLLSGPVRDMASAGPQQAGTMSFTVEDDFRLLHRVLGWSVPGAGLDAQDVAYDTRTGPAETVAKGFIAANAARLGLPVTVAPDQGRGPTITVASRFHPLADRLLTAVDQAGLGITVQQADSGLLVDCYVPRVYPRRLTEASRVVQAWSYSRSGPTATRVVAGGQGEAESRAFYSSTDGAVEAEWGDVVEVFRDARDTEEGGVIAERMAETLAEGAPKAGVSVTLSETKHFRYDPTGTTGIRVGDKVHLEVGPGIVLEDVLRETILEWTTDSGLKVAPVIGERRDDPDRLLVGAITHLARRVRDIASSR